MTLLYIDFFIIFIKFNTILLDSSDAIWFGGGDIGKAINNIYARESLRGPSRMIEVNTCIWNIQHILNKSRKIINSCLSLRMCMSVKGFMDCYMTISEINSHSLKNLFFEYFYGHYTVKPGWL